MRTFGFHRAAKIMENGLSEYARSHIQAYTDGINEYVSSLTILPADFLILRTSFHNWTVVDSLSFFKLLSLDLSPNYNFEGFRYLLKNKFGEDLFPVRSE